MQRSAFLLAAAAAPTRVRAARPLRIVVLGDSLALATGASQADGGFIFPLYRSLLRNRPGSLLSNVAIGGSTVADVLRLQAERVAAFAPDIVIVCVGGNDVVRGTRPAVFTRTYAALLGALRRAVPHASIIACGVPDVGLSPIFAEERASIARLSFDLDRGVRETARAAGVRFVDFGAVVRRGAGADGRFFSRDRFHPSDAGYALLSAELAPALRAAVAAR